MVLSPLSETTKPSSTRFGIVVSLRLGRGLLAHHSLDARDVPADLLDPVRLFHLAGGLLEAQVELLALEVQQVVVQLVGGEAANFFDLHHAASAVWATPASRRV